MYINLKIISCLQINLYKTVLLTSNQVEKRKDVLSMSRAWSCVFIQRNFIHDRDTHTHARARARIHTYTQICGNTSYHPFVMYSFCARFQLMYTQTCHYVSTLEASQDRKLLYISILTIMLGSMIAKHYRTYTQYCTIIIRQKHSSRFSFHIIRAYLKEFFWTTKYEMYVSCFHFNYSYITIKYYEHPCFRPHFPCLNRILEIVNFKHLYYLDTLALCLSIFLSYIIKKIYNCSLNLRFLSDKNFY